MIPFKDREIDHSKPVQVYLNLTKTKNDGRTWWSIRQDGKVVAHTDKVFIENAKFIVNEAGRDRVRAQRRKNVHAWVEGHISSAWVCTKRPIMYNPYKHDSFVNMYGEPVTNARIAKLDVDGRVKV